MCKAFCVRMHTLLFFFFFADAIQIESRTTRKSAMSLHLVALRKVKLHDHSCTHTVRTPQKLYK